MACGDLGWPQACHCTRQETLGFPWPLRKERLVSVLPLGFSSNQPAKQPASQASKQTKAHKHARTRALERASVRVRWHTAADTNMGTPTAWEHNEKSEGAKPPPGRYRTNVSHSRGRALAFSRVDEITTSHILSVEFLGGAMHIHFLEYVLERGAIGWRPSNPSLERSGERTGARAIVRSSGRVFERDGTQRRIQTWAYLGHTYRLGT